LKKITATFSILLILVTSIGAQVAFHYCGNTLQDVAVFRKANPCCGAMETSGCCHDEKVDVKSDAFKVTQLVSNIGFIPVLLSEVTFPILDFSIQFQNSSQAFISYFDDSPPPDPGAERVILIQSFLI
jgi:hypothetical protein